MSAPQGLRAALELIGAYHKGSLIGETLRSMELSSPDRALAHLLSHSTVRRLSLWKSALKEFAMPRPSAFSRVTQDALLLMACGIGELRYFEPAVLVAGLVGVLKKRDFRGSRAANAIGRRMVQELPEWLRCKQSSNSPEDKAELLGVPFWAYQKLFAQWGETVAAALVEHFNKPSRLLVGLFGDEKEQVSLLESAGFSLSHWCNHYWRLNDSALPTELAGYNDGTLWPLTESSAIVARLVSESLPPNGVLVDACSGRGVKTAQVLLHRPDVTVHCFDNSEGRLSALQKRLAAAGLAHRVTVTCCDSSKISFPPCDVAFVDAPCSGSGTWGRHVENKWRINEESLTELSNLGLAIANNALSSLKKGGTFWYSSCSMFSEENEETTACLSGVAFESFESDGWTRRSIGQVLMPTTLWRDGFYLAKGRK